MLPKQEKILRLTKVAKLYYEENYTQQQIAKTLHISRPMVSKLLAEAKDLGLVTITIHYPTATNELLIHRLKHIFQLQEVVLVDDKSSTDKTDIAIATAAQKLLIRLMPKRARLGLGWGTLIEQMTKVDESVDLSKEFAGAIFPLIGGISTSSRSHHTNELIRGFADVTALQASYLYMPAIFDSEQEKNLFESTDAYLDIFTLWNEMNIATVDIANFPSTPDLATAFRFGNKLITQKATGSMLAQYFDVNGTIIVPNSDNVMQIPLELLKACGNNIAVGSATLNPRAVLGALQTGVIQHVVISVRMAYDLLKAYDNLKTSSQ